jgi:hypothetical protein
MSEMRNGLGGQIEVITNALRTLTGASRPSLPKGENGPMLYSLPGGENGGCGSFSLWEKVRMRVDPQLKSQFIMKSLR